MATIQCQKCGKLYDTTNNYGAYHFSSASKTKGTYTSPAEISTLGETMLTCPLDEGERPDEYPTGSTPSGGSMYTGDDRYTAGDEPNPDIPDETADETFEP